MGCAYSKDSKSPRYKRKGLLIRCGFKLFPRHNRKGGRDGASRVSARTSAALRSDNSFVEAIRQDLNTNVVKVEDHKGENEGLVSKKSDIEEKIKDQFDVKVYEGKISSSSMDERIVRPAPESPVWTPPGEEPEKVKLRELMEGHEEDSSSLIKPVVLVSKRFSFDAAASDPDPVHVALPIDDPKSILPEVVKEAYDTDELAQNEPSNLNGVDFPKALENILGSTELENNSFSPNKPNWVEMSSDGKASAPEVVPKKSLQDLSPEYQPNLSPTTTLTSVGKDKHWNPLAAKKTFQSSKKDKVVVYFTSLRGIRQTYEDSCHVRVILKGLGVRVDEKDLCMHSGFKEELKKLLGDTYRGGGLPKVFIGRKYIGGANEIRRLHDEGELEKLFEGCEMVGINGNGGDSFCKGCGDVRFIPCETCSGSCKIFYDYHEEEKEEDFDDDGFGFRRCPDCNENGLIRCPLCCD